MEPKLSAKGKAMTIIELNIAGLHLTRSTRDHQDGKRVWCRAWRRNANRSRAVTEQAA
ncbi:MAG: hypothetical protein ACM4D3_07275 [Candidatus Sericytochromatia bacterium]